MKATACGVHEFLAELRRRNVALSVKDGHIHCRAPQGILTADQLATLRQLKPEIMSALSAHSVESPAVGEPSNRTICEQAPLSFQQQWLWDRMRAAPSINAVVISSSRLRGPLSIGVLSTSLEAVINRHGALRTRFFEKQGIAVQYVYGAITGYELQIVDCDGSDSEEIAQCRMRELFSQQLDGENRSPVEVRLLRLSENDHVLALAAGHLVADHVSFIILYRELWYLYREGILGRQAQLPPASAPYTQYAKWQRDTHAGWLTEHGTYWKSRLAKAERVRWPADTGLGSMPALVSSGLQIPFGQRVSHAIRSLAEREHTTPAITTLALYATFIRCWCEQSDFVIAFSVTGRQSSEYVDTIGYFSHQMPLRIQLAGNESFREALQVVGHTFLAGYSHLECWRAYDMAPELYTGAFFQWLPWPSSEAVGVPVPSEWEGPEYCPVVEPFPVQWPPQENRTGLGVALQFRETPTGISAYGAYCFAPTTMQRFSAALRLLFDHFAHNPDTHIDCLSQLRPR